MFKGIRNKKGFTMIELIAVIVILGIIAAIAVPSMVGYINKAEQKRLDTTARSIFNAASNALSSQYTRGFKGEFNEGDGKVNVELINPKYEEDQANADNIRYLQIKKTDPHKYDSILYRLLEDKIGDKTILQESVIVEYNWKTGNVLSAFFADDKNISSIGYGSEPGQVNAYARDEKTRKKNHIGMWDVNSTGPAEEEPDKPEEKAGVQLVDYGAKYLKDDGEEAISDKGFDINNGKNYGLLTAEWKLPMDFKMSNRESLEMKLNYGGKEISLAKINNLQEYKKLSNNTFEKAIIRNKNKLNNVYIENNTIIAILDTSMADGYNSKGQYVDYVDIKDVVKGLDVTKENPAMQVKASSKGGETFQSGFAKPFFSGGVATSEDTAKIQVSSIRHIKYMDQVLNWFTGTINQTRDIAFRNYNNDIVKREGHTKYLSANYNGNGYTLWDMTVTENHIWNGFFGGVNKGYSVKNLAIDYSDDYWNRYAKANNKYEYFVNAMAAEYCAGLIAGYNEGTISNCQVMGKVTAANSAGGIVGTNQGTVEKCYSGADVVANNYGGGIVGYNKGKVSYCEVGTFASREGDRTKLVGTPMYGLVSNVGKYKENNTLEVLDKVKNDANIISNGGLNYNSSLGGVVGWNDSATGKIQHCLNAAEVVSAKGSSNAGGIVGNNSSWADHNIIYNYNAGTITSKGNAGGIAGYASHTSLVRYCYNTGKIKGSRSSGGLVGYKNSYSRGSGVYESYTITETVIGGGSNENIGYCGYIGEDDKIAGTTAYTKESLKNASFGELRPKGNETTGFFKYPYAYIHHVKEGSGYEYLFHRTPWE